MYARQSKLEEIGREMTQEKVTKDLKVFSKSEVAELLKCSPMTVHRLVRDKKLWTLSRRRARIDFGATR